MTVRLAPPPGAYHRSAVDHDLAAVFAELAAARAADQQARNSRQPGTTFAADRARLVASLRACAAAFEAHQLPLPRTIRDELRLRGQLNR